jgi:integrase
MTLTTFARNEWLPALHNFKPSTRANYEALLEAYIVPHIGDERLCDLTPGRVGWLYGVLRTSGRKRDGKGVSQSTILHTHVVLSKVLTYAVDLGALASNPALRLPKDGRPKAAQRDPAKLKVWTRDEASRFLKATAVHRLAALWRLAIDTGMRRGELAGLRWDDVDLDAGSVTVRRNRVVVGWAISEGTPKTRAAGRTIDLDPRTTKALKAHRKAQLVERLAWGPAYAEGTQVFTREDGEPLHPGTMVWQLERACKAAKVPWIGVHGLRHTSATLGLASGVPLKVMSERLGHARTTITADLYQHVQPGMQADAATKIMGGLG